MRPFLRPSTRLNFFSKPHARYSTASNSSEDVRTRVKDRIKEAMKARDSFASTTLRSVLSEIQLADKALKEPLSDSGILGIIRKATIKRKDAAAQYVQAGRDDLAQNELREVDLLSQFLPNLMIESDIDNALQRILQTLAADLTNKSARGKILQAFYLQIDKSMVDPKTVNERLSVLLKH